MRWIGLICLVFLMGCEENTPPVAEVSEDGMELYVRYRVAGNDIYEFKTPETGMPCIMATYKSGYAGGLALTCDWDWRDR